MVTVSVAELPEHSVLGQRVESSDFLDCYSVASGFPPRRAAEIITEFPGWAEWLLIIRRVLTSPFGLSNDGPDADNKLGAFPVEMDTDAELIAGFDDKHLDFRVSVLSHEGQVFLATWVHPHNLAGRFYLQTILPFHILIARDALRRVRQEELRQPTGN